MGGKSPFFCHSSLQYTSYKNEKDNCDSELKSNALRIPKRIVFITSCLLNIQLVSASSEKTSNAFSWLPSRSPKRSHKASTENVQGVVSPTDTLETLAEKNGGIPLFLERCVEYIEKEGGLEMEGLYRVPGNQAQLSELEKAFREKGDVDIAGLDMPVHVVATAVKNFFSCLAEPLIPTELHQDILDIMTRLTPVNRNVLIYLTSHLERVASSPSTAMDVHNLSKVLFPTLFRCGTILFW
ncbi:unnamed protein product [Haemonchus placei]|uniref:Rho-GAP domain-containing protein n=1 Tax=Haemonchus placei TaxID=6290 RepID=A0A0N4WCE0_HAEPC|nr:unnamed protein product [Haemonchus placei]